MSLRILHRSSLHIHAHGGRDPGGFSLIELLISIMILSLVLAIGLPSLHAAMLTARAAKCLGNIREAGTIAASFALERHELPPHFPIDPVLTDELGVPLIRIEHLRFTVSRNYFDQTSQWIRALRPPADPVPRDLTCTGIDSAPGRRDDPDRFAFTSYTLSAALLADPRLFEDDLVMPLDPAWFRPQALHRVAFPVDKAMLSEQSVAHGTGDYEDVPKPDRVRLRSCSSMGTPGQRHSTVSPRSGPRRTVCLPAPIRTRREASLVAMSRPRHSGRTHPKGTEWTDEFDPSIPLRCLGYGRSCHRCQHRRGLAGRHPAPAALLGFVRKSTGRDRTCELPEA